MFALSHLLLLALSDYVFFPQPLIFVIHLLSLLSAAPTRST